VPVPAPRRLLTPFTNRPRSNRHPARFLTPAPRLRGARQRLEQRPELLALPLATGVVIALPTASSAVADSCAQYSFTNPHLGFATVIPKATLSYGSKGPCVVILQQDLNYMIRAGLKVDGVFGSKTQGAVETYQGRKPGCTGGVDGIAGHYTMSCLAAGSG